MEDIFKNIVVSSRIRLARDLEGYPFPSLIEDVTVADDIIDKVKSVLSKQNGFAEYRLCTLSNDEIECAFEKKKISRLLSENKYISAYFENKKTNIIVMVNEEDHIRLQLIRRGFSLSEIYQEIKKVDEVLLDNLSFNIFEKGFKTACATNEGTGLRASVELFLPALTMTNKIRDIIVTAEKLGLTIRGAFGEGSKAEGYLYQLSNQKTYGMTEPAFISLVEKMTKTICDMEESAREIVFETNRDQIKDSCYRAYGILSNSYVMAKDEMTKLMSQIKLGKSLDAIDLKDENIIEELEIECQDFLLQNRYGKKLTEIEIEKFRADYLSKRLRDQRL